MASLLEQLFGSQGTIEKVPRLEAPQQQFSNEALKMAQQLLPQLLQPTSTEARRGQIENQFQTQYIPSLLERFAQQGPQAQYGSGLESALGGAQKELGLELNALEEGQRGQDLSRLMSLFGGLSNIGLQPQFDREYVPGSQGLVSNFFAPVAQGLGSGLGAPGFLSQLISLLGGRGV